MLPDDGDGEDDSPRVPYGLAGLGDPRGIGGFVAAAFNGRMLADDEATPAQRIQALLGHLTPVAAGDGSDIDDGVGAGIVIDIDPPSGSDGDWGDITNPRALTAFAGSLASATQGIASIGNMVGVGYLKPKHERVGRVTLADIALPFCNISVGHEQEHPDGDGPS